MSQLSLAFHSSLLIRDEQGRYAPATAERILAAARQVIDQKVKRGAAFTSPALAGRSAELPSIAVVPVGSLQIIAWL